MRHDSAQVPLLTPLCERRNQFLLKMIDTRKQAYAIDDIVRKPSDENKEKTE